MKKQKLTARKVAALRKPGFYGDGNGLWLNVRREGSKSWSYRFMLNGRARYLGLGPIHAVSLAEARQRAREARQVILDGRDPIEERRRLEAAAAVERLRTMSFRDAANGLLQTDKIEGFHNDKHRAQWRSTLERYAFPVIGNLPLNEIDTAIVLQVLSPVWRKTPETGSRLRGRIERVFEWARPLGLFIGENPAKLDALKDHLPAKRTPKHHKALPYNELPEFMVDLRQRDSMSAKALEFTILTAARTSETLGAEWDQIDLDAGVWNAPASIMKKKRDHRFPLSQRVIEILRSLPRTGKKGEKVFKLSNMAMLELLRGMVGNGYTVHGFRSAFSDWARDRTNYSRDVIEMSLAHVIKDKSEAAYRRGDALHKRGRLMGEWSRYCEEPQGGADVVAMRA